VLADTYSQAQTDNAINGSPFYKGHITAAGVYTLQTGETGMLGSMDDLFALPSGDYSVKSGLLTNLGCTLPEAFSDGNITTMKWSSGTGNGASAYNKIIYYAENKKIWMAFTRAAGGVITANYWSLIGGCRVGTFTAGATGMAGEVFQTNGLVTINLTGSVGTEGLALGTISGVRLPRTANSNEMIITNANGAVRTAALTQAGVLTARGANLTTGWWRGSMSYAVADGNT
jgi:hypothetical protein